MSEQFTPIETEEQLEAVIAQREQAIKAEAEERFKGYISPEDAQTLNHQITALTAERDTLTEQHSAAKLSAERLKTAYEAGLPIELADRLSGSTPEELKSDAEKILSFISAKPSPKASAERSLKSNENGALLTMLRELNRKD